MHISTQHPLYAAARRFVAAVQSGDDLQAAGLLLRRVELEIQKFSIKQDEALMKRDFDKHYFAKTKAILE